MIRSVWALKIPSTDDIEGVHEFGLSWYHLEEDLGGFEKSLQQNARPALWIKFTRLDHLERILAAFPDAKLGPSNTFSEALIFENDPNRIEELKKKVARLLENENETGEMEAMLREDALEDY